MSSNALFSRSPQPLYLQAAAIFRSNIHNRSWSPGQKIPPLESLVQMYGVSRATIRQALGLLESEGLIRRSRGAGTFINESLPATPDLLIPKNWAETVELSNLLGTVSLVESSSDVALPEALGMPCEDVRDGSFQYLRRLHTSEGSPFCFSEVYLDSRLFRRHATRIKTSTVAPVLDQFYGARLSRARQSLRVVEAGADSAQWLQVPVLSPVAEIRRYASIEGRVVYFARLEFPFRNLRMEFDLLG
jgi:GntR family transcriptional regulator